MRNQGAESGRFSEEGLEKAWQRYEQNRSAKIPMLDEEMPHCNDNCLHCGVAEIMEGAVQTTLEQVVRHLRVLAPSANGRVMLGVSELTIRPDFIKILRAANRLGYRTVAVVTNGRRFSSKVFTKAAAREGMSHALVSVYGPNERIHEAMTRTPDSYVQTTMGIQELLQTSIRVMTNTVVTKRNLHCLEETVTSLHQLGVRRACLSFVQKIGNAKRYADRLIPSWKEAIPAIEKAVYAGRELGMVMGVGGLPPCVMPGMPEAFGVDDLTYIFNAENTDQIRSRSPYGKEKACLDCGERVVCLGVQEETLHQDDLSLLQPARGSLKSRRHLSELGYSMFPDLFEGSEIPL